MNIALTPMRFLDRAIRLHGDRTAVVCEGDRWTYAQFGQRVNRLANALQKRGVKPGDRVAFLGYNCHRLLECYYGVPLMGAVLLPLNIRLAPQDFEYILNDAEPVVVLVHPDFLDKLERRLGMTDFESPKSDGADARIEAVARRIAQNQDHDKDSGTPADDIEQAWDELRKRREHAKEEQEASEVPPPNPRTLG